MSAGVTYLVDIEMAVKGDPAAGLGNVESKITSLSRVASATRKEVSAMGTGIVDGFTGAIENVAGKLAALAKVGAAAVAGGITYGVVGLNSELETTKISLGAV